MDLTSLLLGTGEYALLLLGALLCLLLVRKYLRVPAKILFPILFPGLLLLCAGVTYFGGEAAQDSNLFLFPIMAVCLAAYFLLVRLEKRKLFYVFHCAVTLLSFGGLINHVVEARLYPDGREAFGYSTWGLLAQWGISLVITALFLLLFGRKLAWMLDNFHSRRSWRMAWLVPATITFCNLMMLPSYNTTMSVGRVFLVFWFLEAVLMFLFSLFQNMFYLVTKSSADKYEAEKAAQLAELQRSQYEGLRAHFEQTERLRHDFRHVVRTIDELLDSRQYEELQRYVETYSRSELRENARFSFCRHAAVNALLTYYAGMAAENGIDPGWEVNLPQELGVSDVDLCVVLGNLLENAIQACASLPPEERQIRLTVDADTPGELYIVMMNRYAGTLREKDGRFLSTKAGGSGIGLSSVAAVAGKYHGETQFRAADGEFTSSVMLQLEPRA